MLFVTIYMDSVSHATLCIAKAKGFDYAPYASSFMCQLS